MKLKPGDKIAVDGIQMTCVLETHGFGLETYRFTWFVDGDLKECTLNEGELDALGACKIAEARYRKNCERFDTTWGAMAAFLEEVWLVTPDLTKDSFDNWTDEMKQKFVVWLYDPVAAQKET